MIEEYENIIGGRYLIYLSGRISEQEFIKNS